MPRYTPHVVGKPDSRSVLKRIDVDGTGALDTGLGIVSRSGPAVTVGRTDRETRETTQRWGSGE